MLLLVENEIWANSIFDLTSPPPCASNDVLSDRLSSKSLDRPESAAWLEPEQSKWLVERLAIERGRCVVHHGFSVARALSSGVVWQLGLLGFLSISFGQYALGLWLPQIVRGFSGLSTLQVGFVSAIPDFVAVIAMGIVAVHSDRTGERCLHIAAASAGAAAGFFGCALVRSPALSVMFLSIASAGFLSAHGPFWPLPSAPGGDVHTEVPRYRVYRRGALAEEPTEITRLWRKDLVAFLLGCSFSFEAAMQRAGLPYAILNNAATYLCFGRTCRAHPQGPFGGRGCMFVTDRLAEDVG